MTDLDQLIVPPTPVAGAALDVAREWSSPAMVNHCLRSWVWASRLADHLSLHYDAELLYVSAMLHDLGVASHFDALTIPFEVVGGALAWSFAAGAGWPADRRARVQAVIEAHAWAEVDPASDTEGYLLEAATSLDVAGSGFERWNVDFLCEVTREVPRLNFSDEFGDSIRNQALRKPSSEAARFQSANGVERGRKVWQIILFQGQEP
ncbi:HD domain-containing protein [Subtercola boreus]|uniref:HD domain-containing protein n=1 Tax=Subtercola boreus TaxID=120213 RepID=UPI001C0EA7A3|nr:HD domain-containing protein [Subtercola boreus]